MALDGEINENTILGSREQFIQSAIKAGDLSPDSSLARSIMTPKTQAFLAEEIYNHK